MKNSAANLKIQWSKNPHVLYGRMFQLPPLYSYGQRIDMVMGVKPYALECGGGWC